MFVQSSRVAVYGIIAIICGNLSGRLMGFDKSFLSCGLFGYNSFLVGLAIATFDSSNTHAGYNWSAVIGVIIASYFSSVLFVMLGKMLAPYKVSLTQDYHGVTSLLASLSDHFIGIFRHHHLLCRSI
jgi:urea transporter